MRAVPSQTRAASLFAVERVTGAPNVLAHLARAHAAGAVVTPFQSEAWIAALDADVAPALAASTELLSVTDPATHEFLLALPITVRRVGGLRVAEIADLGASDYQAPVIGPAAASIAFDAPARAALLAALGRALADVDMLRFEKMPREIVGRANPLAMLAGARPSRFSANRLTVETTVEAFIAARGKKYRKEAERCFRRIAEEGEVRFARAETAAEIEAAYAQLEAWQHARHAEAGHVYALARPELSRFYRRLALAGMQDSATLVSPSPLGGAGRGEGACTSTPVARRFASIFTLGVGGRPVAILYGVENAGTFTLLRIADAGEDWKHVSPGRLVVIETMRHMVGRGIRVFDMGIGDYPFKHWIGCTAHPLVDLDVALRWRAWPRVAAAGLKRRLRENERVRALVARLRSVRPPSAVTAPVETDA